jgi:hypothetical protein
MSYGSHLNKLGSAGKLAVKKGVFYEVATGKSHPNLALLKPDKCMWPEEIRSLFIGLCVEDNGHAHEDFHVLLSPDDIFQQDGITFIPAIGWKCPSAEKVPIPTWMLDLLPGQFKRIAKVAAENGVVISKLDFMKPRVAIGAAERMEYEEPGNVGSIFDN